MTAVTIRQNGLIGRFNKEATYEELMRQFDIFQHDTAMFSGWKVVKLTFDNWPSTRTIAPDEVPAFHMGYPIPEDR